MKPARTSMPVTSSKAAAAKIDKAQRRAKILRAFHKRHVRLHSAPPERRNFAEFVGILAAVVFVAAIALTCCVVPH